MDIARLFDVRGKVAIVTGASKGTGRMAASALAAAAVNLPVAGGLATTRLTPVAQEAPK
jgi:NAD(P)-dependent dehydrogenase (short-subunit alcohol dehydrogenase family)